MQRRRTTVGNNGHNPKAQSIYGDHHAFGRIQRLVGEVLAKRGGPLGNGQMAANDSMTARATWLDSAGGDDIDPRRSIYDECGYPTTRFMTPQRWQLLYDRSATANRVTSFMAEEAFQVQPTVYEKEATKVVTPFEVGWRELGSQLRSQGLRSFFGEEEGSPVADYHARGLQPIQGRCCLRNSSSHWGSPSRLWQRISPSPSLG